MIRFHQTTPLVNALRADKHRTEELAQHFVELKGQKKK
jgi:hypothetical protein